MDVDSSYFDYWAPGPEPELRRARLEAHLHGLFSDIDHIFSSSDEFSYALAGYMVHDGRRLLGDESAVAMDAGPALNTYSTLLVSDPSSPAGMRKEDACCIVSFFVVRPSW